MNHLLVCEWIRFLSIKIANQPKIYVENIVVFIKIFIKIPASNKLFLLILQKSHNRKIVQFKKVFHYEGREEFCIYLATLCHDWNIRSEFWMFYFFQDFLFIFTSKNYYTVIDLCTFLGPNHVGYYILLFNV